MKPLVIHGAPGAGHRMISRCLRAGGIEHEAWHLPGKVFKAERYILPVRTPTPNARSILKEGMVRDIETARDWVDEARETQARLFTSAPSIYVQYEAIVRNGGGFLVARLSDFLGVPPWEWDEEIYDGNLQYGGSSK